MAPARPLAAGLWMLGGVLCFSLLAVAGRAVSDAHDAFEIVLYRSAMGLGVMVVAAWVTGNLRQLSGKGAPLSLHLTRNVAHFAGQFLWFYAITVLPLAQVFALEFTTPIWVLLLSPLLLGEHITRRGAAAAILGFAGILVVARPDATPDPGLIAAALCALGFALSAILTRRLTRTESLMAILFWLCLFQVGLALICAGLDGDLALPARADLGWLALIGAAGLLAHVCLTRALQLAPAAQVMPVDFLRLPLIAVIGVTIYAEPLDRFILLGGGLILLANWVNLRRGAATPAPPRPADTD